MNIKLQNNCVKFNNDNIYFHSRHKVILEPITKGKGFTSFINKKVSTGYISKYQKIFDKNKNLNITKIVIGRTPLDKFTNMLLNVVSLGQFQEQVNKSSFDDMFHLYVMVKLSNDKKLYIHKTHVATIDVSNVQTSETEKLEVILNKNITLDEFITNTQNKMGSNYFLYSAFSNNCQDFVVNLLEANNLLTEENKLFVKQDVTDIAKKLKKTSKFADNVTNVASIFTNILS